MWDFHHPLPLIEARLFFSFGVLVIFFNYAFEESTNLLAQLSLGHDFDTMLNEHDSTQ